MAPTLKRNVPPSKILFVTGKRDLPADGVQDYCEYLGHALARRGICWEIVRVNWNSDGWFKALRELRTKVRESQADWVILQYTTIAWSKRGFSLGAIAALAAAKRSGARRAVVFHEPAGFQGQRVIDRIRGAFQNWVIRSLHRKAEKSIFPDPLETIAWLPENDPKAACIPIGANLPDGPESNRPDAGTGTAAYTIAIYCLSDPPNLYRELDDIAHAARMAVAGGARLRVVFIGRGTPEAKVEIERAFDGVQAEVLNLGIQTPEELRRALAEADVMLCVRGVLFPRRGSALAGIACGLPIVAYAGAAEGTPIAEAGVVLVPYGDREALGAATQRILADQDFWHALHEKSLLAHRRYFSWGPIAEKFIDALDLCAGEQSTAESREMRAGG